MAVKLDEIFPAPDPEAPAQVVLLRDRLVKAAEAAQAALVDQLEQEQFVLTLRSAYFSAVKAVAYRPVPVPKTDEVAVPDPGTAVRYSAEETAMMSGKAPPGSVAEMLDKLRGG